MATDDAAFSNKNHKEASFTEDPSGSEWSEEFHSGAAPTHQDALESKGSKEHFEDPDDPCRSALMDCYNK
jgi:hypothetical protein